MLPVAALYALLCDFSNLRVRACQFMSIMFSLQVFVIPMNHDAWVEGEQEAILLDFFGELDKHEFAKEQPTPESK